MTIQTKLQLNVVDADGHYHEPMDGTLVDYIDPTYRDMAPRLVVNADGTKRRVGKAWMDDNPKYEIQRLSPKVTKPGEKPTWRDGVGKILEQVDDVPSIQNPFQLELTKNPSKRLEILDSEGMDASVLYPTAALTWMKDQDYHLALNAALNNWLADYVKADSRRLYGAANIVGVHDVEKSNAELTRCVKDLGFIAAFLRSCHARPEARWWTDWYDAFWANVQDLDVAIGIHPFPADEMYGAARLFDFIGPHNVPLVAATPVIHPIDMMMFITQLIFGGIFDRFPRLRIGILESGGGWLLSLLERLDGRYEHLAHAVPHMTMKPSDYFRQNMWISFDPEEPPLKLTAEWLGADRIIWGSDFPHLDAFYPGFMGMLNSNIEGLPVEDQQKIRGVNARDFYKLPSEI